MRWSISTPRFPVEGDGGKCSCAMDLSSPLAGEGQGRGEPAFHARRKARSWPLRSPVRFVRILLTPSGGFGRGCVNGRWRDVASGDRLPSDRTSSTSRVSRRGWSLRLMGASTAGGPSKIARGRRGWKPTDSKSCGSGITRCLPAPTGCWRRSAEPCRTKRWIDPPPRPSPAGGEGGLFCASRLIEGGARLTSAPSSDEVDRSGLVPTAAPAPGGEMVACLKPNSLPPRGGGLGWGVHRA